MKPSVKICVNLWLVAALLLVPALPADAARRPKRQEVAPEIKAQVLERRLAETDISAPERARLSIELAETYYQLRDFESEAEVLEDALASGIPDTNLAAQAHYYLGRTYQALGSPAQATDQFETVRQQFPGSRYELYTAMELGDLSIQAGDVEAGAEWYQTIIAQSWRSKLAFLARDKLSAIASNLNAQAITDESNRPVHLKVQFRRLDQYLYSRMYSNADALAQHLIIGCTNAPLRAAMNFHLAHRYWMYGHVEGAANFVAEALNTTGDRRVEALILAGHIKRALGEDEAALAYYQQAIAVAPAKPMTITAYQQSTRLLLRQGRQADALALDDQGMQAYTATDKLPAYLERISNTLRDRAMPQWRDYAAQVAATATNDVGFRALQKLASEAALRRDWPAAQQYYEQLTTRPVNDGRQALEAKMALLNALLQQHKTNEAASLETAILDSLPAMAADSHRAYTLYRLAKTWQQNGNQFRAETLWNRVVQDYAQSKRAAMAWVKLGQSCETRGDLTGAVHCYQNYLARSQDEPRFKLQAYANLVRLKQAMGDTALAGQDLAAARLLALQTHDAELELKLSQYYLRRGDRGLARELLDQGLVDADAALKEESDGNKRLRREFLIARRLHDFNEYGRLAARLSLVESELLQNPALDDSLRYHCYFMLIQSMEYCGLQSEAETVCQRAIQSVPEDSRTLSAILHRLSQQAEARGEDVTVHELAETAFSEQPTDHFAQHMYLFIAIEDFNAGNAESALAKVSKLERAVPLAKLGGWAERFQWDCQYLKGRCLCACGHASEGQCLINESLAQKPDTPLPQLLDQPPGGGY